jgi:hydroxymethylglutaryl-CoA lyase
MTSFDLPKRTQVVEVGLRDGLQSVDHSLPTEAKVELVHLLIDAGVTVIEVASFAHPRVLPQLADAEEVLARVPRLPGIRYRALVPNLKGARRAVACGVDEVVALACCDDKVSRINQGRDCDGVLDEFPAIAETCRTGGAAFVAGVAMAFFAPVTGIVDQARRDYIVRRAVEAGASSIYLADSIGLADPILVEEAVASHREQHPTVPVGLHLHTRNGCGLANALTGLSAGADWLESAFGGLGGDLWFPGTPEVLGNLATEDLVAFAAALHVSTGIDAEKYKQVSEAASRHTGRASMAHAIRGGSRNDLLSVDWPELLAAYGRPTTSRPIGS